MLAGFEHTCAGHGNQAARITVGEVMQLGVQLAFFALQGKPVVVIDQHCRHFAILDSFERHHVVGVGLAEGTQASQPFFCGFTAMQFDDGHGLFLKRAAGGHETDLALPFGVSKVQYRLWEVLFINLFRVERNHASTCSHADPRAIGGHVFLGQCLQGGVISLGQETLFAQVVQWRGFLGVEHVGGRAITFFHDLAGQLVAAAFAHIHMNAGLGFERGGEVITDLLVLTVVERQGDFVGGVGGRCGECETDSGDRQAAQ